MPGIYLHIPFCKQACHYCDFHFSTLLKYKDDFVKALCTEIELQKNFFGDKIKIDTLYFGGGTPSMLSGDELNKILDVLFSCYNISPDAEITLEANPDDLTIEKLRVIKNTVINRFSVGVQSFHEKDLIYLNRVHNSQEAISAVKRSQDTGIENITVDLIYGIPTLPDEGWKKNLEMAVSLDIKHLSAYCLTIERGTALNNLIQKKRIQNIDEIQSSQHFEMLMNFMEEKKFIQYEISNFCREGFYSKHNSSYWKGEHYLGLGPSAHSYNGSTRKWNVANNQEYIRNLETGKLKLEEEELSPNQKYNEYIMTSLRTIWGSDLTNVKENYGESYYSNLVTEGEKYIRQGYLTKEKNKFFLTKKGKFIADKIASDLFIV